jgi:hypothetical protein
MPEEYDNEAGFVVQDHVYLILRERRYLAPWKMMNNKFISPSHSSCFGALGISVVSVVVNFLLLLADGYA